MPMPFGKFLNSGPKRQDLIGKPVGPYVVSSYVGDNPDGQYVRITCPDCGHEITPKPRGHIACHAKVCAKCGRSANPKVPTQGLLDNAAE